MRKSAMGLLTALIGTLLVAPQPAYALESLSLSSALGDSLVTSVDSVFALKLETSGLSSGQVVTVKVDDPSGGLLPSGEGFQIRTPTQDFINGSPNGSSSVASYVAEPKTVRAGGILSSDLHLPLSGSPYKFTSMLQIPSGITVTADPGVILDFSSSTDGTFFVNGILNLEGTSNDPIRVLGSDADFFIQTSGQPQVRFSNAGIVSRSTFFDYASSGSLEISGSSVQANRLGYFYGSFKLILHGNVFKAGSFDYSSSNSQSSVTQNTFYGYSSFTASPSIQISENDFSNSKSNTIFTVSSSNLNLQGNYWGTTDQTAIQSRVLDSSDTLERTGTIDTSSPLAERPIGAPSLSANSTLPAYLDSLESQALTLAVLSPSKTLRESFQVSVTAFIDLDSDGVLDAGEASSGTKTISFKAYSELGMFSEITTGSYLGTNLQVRVWFGSNFNGRQIDYSYVQGQVFESTAWVSMDLSGSYSSYMWYSKTVPAITSDIQFRVLTPDGATAATTKEIRVPLGASLQLSTTKSGSYVLFKGTLRDADDAPLQLNYDDTAKLSATYTGPGSIWSELTSVTTGSAGTFTIYLRLGASDFGVGTLQVTLDPDGTAGSASLITQEISVLITPSSPVLVQNSGVDYIVTNGKKVSVGSEYSALLESMGPALDVSDAVLQEVPGTSSFTGVFKKDSSSGYFYTTGNSLHKISDCDLAAQFGYNCDSKTYLSNEIYNELRVTTGVTDPAELAFPGNGLQPTPVISIFGTPAVGKSITASITNKLPGSQMSIRWIKAGNPEVVLAENRLIYKIQDSDLGSQILVEITTIKNLYDPRTDRSVAVSITQTAEAIAPPQAPVPQAPTQYTGDVASWTKKLSTNEAKIYAKDVVGAGKVQFFLNGKEIAWVNATSEADVRLRSANGSSYLVRTVSLDPGKNVLEVFVDGVRTSRAAYTN